MDVREEAIQNYNPQAIGKRIQQLRRDRHLSQEQLAEKLNVSQNTIAKIECGLRSPSIDFVVEMGEFFEASIDYILLGIVEDKEGKKQKLDQLIGQLDQVIEKLQKEKERLLLERKELE